MNTDNPSLCPIPGRYFGKPWSDLPDNALQYALAAANFGQPAAVADALSDAHLNALMDEIERRAGFAAAPAAPPAAPEPPQEPQDAAPTSPAHTPAPEPTTAPEPFPTPSAPARRGRGRPRIHPPKRKLTPEELSAVRAAAGRKGAANSPVARPKPPDEKVWYQAVKIRVETLERLRSWSVYLDKAAYSDVIDQALDALGASRGVDY